VFFVCSCTAITYVSFIFLKAYFKQKLILLFLFHFSRFSCVFLNKIFSIFNIKKKADKNTLTRDNEDFAVDDPSPININNSSIPEPDAPNNIQPEHSGITLSDSFQLDLGDLVLGPT